MSLILTYQLLRRCRGRGMPTDYDANQFVERYLRARSLSSTFVESWSRFLSARIPAAEVSVMADIGAGPGRFWPVFAAAWSPDLVVAVDRSSAMLASSATLRSTSPTVACLVADLDALPLSVAGRMDLVFCSMALHYSRDPRNWVYATAKVIRPGGWLCVRTGTDETLKSFDFLPYFPTALAAERAAMPTVTELRGWLDVPSLEITSVDDVEGGPPVPRRHAFAAACRRGFPSMQLVPHREFLWGLLRYGIHLLWAWATGTPRQRERSILVTARRTA